MSRVAGMSARQHGVVLIVVLWVLALLMVLLAAFSTTVRVDRQVASELILRAKGRAATDAAVAYLSAMHRLSEEQWQALLGQTLILPGEDPVRFRVLPEEAYVSMTGGSQELLLQLVASIDDTVSPAPVVDAILSWREADQEAAGFGQVVVHSLDELLVVPGVTQQFLERMRPFVTFDSQHEGVALRYASWPLRRMLLGDTASERPEPDTAGPAEGDASVSGDIYRIQVEVAQSTGKARKVEVTVSFGGEGEGLRLLRINEYTARFDLG